MVKTIVRDFKSALLEHLSTSSIKVVLIHVHIYHMYVYTSKIFLSYIHFDVILCVYTQKSSAYSECCGSMVSSGHVLKNPITRLVWDISAGRDTTCCREREREWDCNMHIKVGMCTLSLTSVDRYKLIIKFYTCSKSIYSWIHTNILGRINREHYKSHTIGANNNATCVCAATLNLQTQCI